MDSNVDPSHQRILDQNNIDVFNAIINNDLSIVNDYISHNDIDDRLLYGQTLLTFACFKVKIDIVKLLLDSGADPNKTSGGGMAPLSTAVSMGDISIVQLLLQHGANVNLTNDIGRTALHQAASYNHKVIVEILLKVGADTTIKDKNGWTAKDCAEYKQYVDIIELLQIGKVTKPATKR